MDMQGSRQLAVTQQQAWDALNDPAVLKACIPGCDKVEATGENQYAIAMALKIGPVSAKFTGKISLTEMNPPASYKLSFDGQGGVAGFGKGSAAVTLTPNNEGCELSYTVHASVGGKVAQLGQRLIDGAAKSMAEDFFRRFDGEMQRQHPESYAAKMVMGDVAAEPAASGPAIPVWVWTVAAAVLIAAAVWLAQ
ncbi:carbon monoxide dehydrogenase subunit G [Polaromonas sp.]|uniref:SRPBCC family protein n=1 Tax=Polaromonas sp. TaxID=1869339 RepID=UPI00326507A3